MSSSAGVTSAETINTAALGSAPGSVLCGGFEARSGFLSVMTWPLKGQCTHLLVPKLCKADHTPSRQRRLGSGSQVIPIPKDPPVIQQGIIPLWEKKITRRAQTLVRGFKGSRRAAARFTSVRHGPKSDRAEDLGPNRPA